MGSVPHSSRRPPSPLLGTRATQRERDRDRGETCHLTPGASLHPGGCVMAAIDLRRGLEHGGRGWGPERADATDGFDSEMQEWEDQLQDMQKKIEELYNEVQARRGGSDVTTDKQKNGDALAFGLGHAGHSRYYDGATGDHLVTAATAPKRHGGGNGFGCGYGRGPDGYGYAADHRNGGYGYGCHGNGVASEIGDLLQDYLGQGKDMRRKNNGARRVHFNDTIAVSRDLPKPQDDGRSGAGNGRNCHSQPSGSVEETENHKNRTSRTKDKENTCAKPPLRQRDPSPSPSGGRGRDDDALMELLDMLDIQHEYSAAGPRGGHAAHRQGPPQVNPAESSTATHTNNFSRPARPANQRPPSRWASRTPSAKITAPSGPMYRPPSPLARPASPLTRSPSPAPKHKSPICYSRQIETVIM